MRGLSERCFAAACLIIAFAVGGFAQRVADPDFDTRVAQPTYTGKRPRVLFDEAHHNLYVAKGLYKPFSDLIASDGYQITQGTMKFSKENLRGFQVLVISNALGAPGLGSPDEASRSAFTEEECDAVRDWVRDGGSLLLIAGPKMGAANARLGERFGVDMSNGYTIDDATHDLSSYHLGLNVFTRGNGLLGDHPITRGRDDRERLSRIMSFEGQSLKGPAGSAFMKLSKIAVDKIPTGQGHKLREVSAMGRAQGLAFEFGKGRVVVLAGAIMIWAHLFGPTNMKVGMNRPGTDNRQLALNILHWLSGALK